MFTNSGSAGTTGYEYGGVGNPYTVVAASIGIPSGANAVTLGNITLVMGPNYVTIGNPGHSQGSISINSLTFT
jgi:hypothetical protein